MKTTRGEVESLDAVTLAMARAACDIDGLTDKVAECSVDDLEPLKAHIAKQSLALAVELLFSTLDPKIDQAEAQPEPEAAGGVFNWFRIAA